jgi:hypothetical protein
MFQFLYARHIEDIGNAAKASIICDKAWANHYKPLIEKVN